MMKSFKWHGIPVNIPNTHKEWLFFSTVILFSIGWYIGSLLFRILKTILA
ncbi:MAG: hypothetical protein MK083_05815 [Dehalococcoidia bacterium]|nr:hypothetical protein [Dehalococcoidia bacterium]